MNIVGLWRRSLAICASSFLLLQPGPAQTAGALPAGSYEITFRLELPHLESWAIEKTTTTCVSEGNAILPILSDNHPFAGCSAMNVRRDEDTLTYEIVCKGRDVAKAQATYTLALSGFMGRIAMRMGAKNMTMTEVQTGRRVASCEEITRQER